MDLGLTLIIALILGGIAGTVINMVATRLPADLGMLGYPLRPTAKMSGDDPGIGQSASPQPDRRAIWPWFGARMEGTPGIDWPKLGTELGAAAVFAVAFLSRGYGLDGWRAAVFALLLLLILRIDWQNHLIYIITIVPGILLAFGLHAADSGEMLLSSAVAGAAGAFVFLLLFLLAYAIYRQHALGIGDIFLAALIGAMTGLKGISSALLLGMFLAGIGGLFLIAIRVRSRKDFIPYGAYLSLGAMVVVLVGNV